MTRPKKRILLVCPDDTEASLLSYFLSVRGYYVLLASDAREAQELVASTWIDLALIEFELEGVSGNELTRRFKALLPDLRVILTSKSILSGARAHDADSFLGRGTSPMELFERLKVMTTRKRGPKKQPKAIASIGAEVCVA